MSGDQPPGSDEATRSSQVIVPSRKGKEKLIDFSMGEEAHHNNIPISPTLSRPLNTLNLFNPGPNKASNECWVIPNPRTNNPPPPPPNKQTTAVPLPPAVQMTRDAYFESCLRGGCGGGKCIYKGKEKMNESTTPNQPPPPPLPPRPPRIPNLPSEIPPSLQEDSTPKKNRYVISSRTSDKRGPMPMSYFNPNILPESDPKHHDEPDSSLEPAPETEHTMKLFGKVIKTTIPSSSSSEAMPNMEHGSGEEQVGPDVISRQELLEMKAETWDAHMVSVWTKRWIRNKSRIGKRNTDVVREIMMSGEKKNKKKEKEKVPSVAAMAMVGRALNDSKPCEIKKMSGYSVWD